MRTKVDDVKCSSISLLFLRRTSMPQIVVFVEHVHFKMAERKYIFDGAAFKYILNTSPCYHAGISEKPS